MTYKIKAIGGYFEGLAVGGQLLPIRPILDAILVSMARPSFGPLAWTTEDRAAADGIAEILRGQGHAVDVVPS